MDKIHDGKYVGLPLPHRGRGRGEQVLFAVGCRTEKQSAVEKTSLKPLSGVALRFSVQSRTRKMDLKNQIHTTPSYRIEIYIILVSLMGKMSLRNLRGLNQAALDKKKLRNKQGDSLPEQE